MTAEKIRVLGGTGTSAVGGVGASAVGLGDDSSSLRGSVEGGNLAASLEIVAGAKVEANYRGKGKWYPGKVSRDRGDGTYDISYDVV